MSPAGAAPDDAPLGHAAAERIFHAAAASGRMHHAWLLLGAEGIGKAMLARRFARALLCGLPGPGLDVPADHPAARLVARGSHPDLLTVAPGWDDRRRRARAEIVVEEIRAVAAFLSLTPAMGGWRVVVVDGADRMNRNAANALLKLLEEPPSRTLLLLTARAAGALLPTVRSRCRRIALAPLGPDALRAVVARHLPPGIPPAAAERLCALSGGSPGRVLGWLEAGLAGLVPAMDRAVGGALGAGAGQADRAGQDAADALFEAAGRENATTLAALALLRAELADRVGARARAGESAGALAGPAGAWSELGRIGTELDRFNLDRRQAILDAFRMLAPA